MIVSFHFNVFQDENSQLQTWRILLRALDASQHRLNSDFEKKYDITKQYLAYLLEEGCANPTASSIGGQTQLKKAAGDKVSYKKPILIPRDLEKIIRSTNKTTLSTEQLGDIR